MSNKARRGRGEGSFELLPSGRVRAIVSRVIDGKRVKESRTFDSKREAMEWKDSKKGKVDRPGTVKEWLSTWLGIIKPDVANKTYSHDRQRVNRWLLPRLGKFKLRDLTALKIRTMLSEMHDEGHSDSERQKAGAVLRKSLNAAVSYGQLSVSPMLGIKLPNPKRDEKRSLSPDQVKQFLAACGSYEHVFRVWVDAGLRPGELLALHWEDFNLEKGTVSIRRALDGITNEVKEPKTKKSRRTLQLSTSTVAQLVVARQAAISPLFTHTVGLKYFWQNNFRTEIFMKIREKTGVDFANLYTFRHTCATLLLRAGIPIKVVSERLGHEDVATTLRTYAHVMEGDQDKAAAAMEMILNPVSHDSPIRANCGPEKD